MTEAKKIKNIPILYLLHLSRYTDPLGKLYTQSILKAMQIAHKNKIPIVCEEVDKEIIEKARKLGVKSVIKVQKRPVGGPEKERIKSIKNHLQERYGIKPKAWIVGGEYRGMCLSIFLNGLGRERKYVLLGHGTYPLRSLPWRFTPSFLRKNKIGIMSLNTLRTMKGAEITVPRKKTLRGVIAARGLEWRYIRSGRKVRGR